MQGCRLNYSLYDEIRIFLSKLANWLSFVVIKEIEREGVLDGRAHTHRTQEF